MPLYFCFMPLGGKPLPQGDYFVPLGDLAVGIGACFVPLENYNSPQYVRPVESAMNKGNRES